MISRSKAAANSARVYSLLGAEQFRRFASFHHLPWRMTMSRLASAAF
jgi:hypothetical protein